MYSCTYSFWFLHWLNKYCWTYILSMMGPAHLQSCDPCACIYAELSHRSLEFPREILAILDRVDGKSYGQPVWTFAKHGNGYSLKLFWKALSGVSLDNAHSTVSGRKSRNKRRLVAFIAKKRAEASCSSKQPATSGVSSQAPGISNQDSNRESTTCTSIQLEPVASGPLNLEPARPPVTSSQVNSNAGSTNNTQLELVASGPLNLEPAVYPSSSMSLCEKVVGKSPVASRTRSRANLQVTETVTCLQSTVATVEPVHDESASQPVNSFTTSAPLVLELPDLPGITRHYVDFVKCDDVDTANRIKDSMQQQWSDLVKPGQKVKVKLKDEPVAAVVAGCQLPLWLRVCILYPSCRMTICTSTQLLRRSSD